MSTFHTPTRQSLPRVIFDLLTRIRRLEALKRTQFATYEIKLFADENALDGTVPLSSRQPVIGDAKFVFAVSDELFAAADEWYLVKIRAFVSTTGTGPTEVMIRNITNGDVDMLTDPATIPSGETTSCDQGDIIDYDNDQVFACDLLALDVDAAAAGAEGLGVIITLSSTPGDAA